MLTIIPVFSKVFFWNFAFVLIFLSTSKSQNIILPIPNSIPKKTAPKLVSSNASGNKSKHTIATISPDAKAKMKLKNLWDGFLNLIPINPPIVVPKVPKNNPISVVFIISLKIKNSFKIKYSFILF